MKSTFFWKCIDLIILVSIIIIFIFFYSHRTGPDDSVINDENIVQKISTAEGCYQRISQSECYGTCSIDDCPDAICPEKIRQAFCACMGGLLNKSDCFIKGETRSAISFDDMKNGYYWGSDQKKSGTPDNWHHKNKGTRSEGWFKPD